MWTIQSTIFFFLPDFECRRVQRRLDAIIVLQELSQVLHKNYFSTKSKTQKRFFSTGSRYDDLHPNHWHFIQFHPGNAFANNPGAHRLGIHTLHQLRRCSDRCRIQCVGAGNTQHQLCRHLFRPVSGDPWWCIYLLHCIRRRLHTVRWWLPRGQQLCYTRVQKPVQQRYHAQRRIALHLRLLLPGRGVCSDAGYVFGAWYIQQQGLGTIQRHRIHKLHILCFRIVLKRIWCGEFPSLILCFLFWTISAFFFGHLGASSCINCQVGRYSNSAGLYLAMCQNDKIFLLVILKIFFSCFH